MSSNLVLKVEDMESKDNLRVTARKITYVNGEKKGVIILRDHKTGEVRNILEVTDMAPLPAKLWDHFLSNTPDNIPNERVN